MGWLPYVKGLISVSESLLGFNGYCQHESFNFPFCPSILLILLPSICLNGGQILSSLSLRQATQRNRKYSRVTTFNIIMEKEMQCKRSRVYSSNPNPISYTAFSHKYITYLLPALLRVTNYEGKQKATPNNNIEKIVRFEVDMALVHSTTTNEFKWTLALKHRLNNDEEIMKANKTKLHHMSLSSKCNFGVILPTLPTIPRPINYVKKASRPRRKDGEKMKGSKINRRVLRGDKYEELGCRIRALRRILPGGSEMEVGELLDEVESYVVCLQLQVHVLRSLIPSAHLC